MSAIATGIAWTILPSLSNNLVAKSGFSFSEAQYGILTSFLNIAAVITAILVTAKRGKIRSYSLWIWGLCFLAISKLGIPIASMVSDNVPVKFLILSIEESFTGAGIALLVSAFNFLLVFLVPKHSPAALTAMYGSISIGSAITPYLVSYLTTIISWKILPLFLFLLLSSIFLIVISFIRFAEEKDFQIQKLTDAFFKKIKLYGFLLIIFFYSCVETIYGYWSLIYLHEKGISTAFAEIALSVFWGAFAIGQLITSFAIYWISPKKIFFALMFIALIGTSWVISLNFLSFKYIPFALGGLGCSGIYPLTVNFFQKSFTKVLHFVSSMVVGIYFCGVALNSIIISAFLKSLPNLIGNLFLLALISIIVLFLIAIPVIFKHKSES